VYYGNFGDVTGDGKPDMVMSGWTVNTGNASGRIFILELDPENGITNIEWTNNEGTAAAWVEDFDGDGIDEIMSIGFYDFPVAPAPTVYFDGGLDNGVIVGPDIDSHESAMVDFDQDGDLDVVAITYNGVSGFISLYTNTGNAFEHQYLPVEQSSWFASGSSIEYADFDGDGFSEFIVGDYAGDHGLAILKLKDDGSFLNSPEWKTILNQRPYFESEIFNGIESLFTINNPDATPQNIIKLRSHDVAFKIIDLNSDGHLDIINSTSIWSDDTAMGVYQMLINQGDGTFKDETNQRLFNFSLTAQSSHDPILLDVNNDGFLDLITPDASVFGGNANLDEDLWVDAAKLTEPNSIHINDGEGYFLQTMFAPFSREGTFQENGSFYPNKWYPIVHQDGSLGFVQLDHHWQDYPNGEYDLFNYAHLDQTLYTGPKFVNPSYYDAPGFNEFYVLRNNPDIQELVKTGVYGSALEWYLEANPVNINTFAKNAKVVGSKNDDIIKLREGDETAFGEAGNDTIYVYDGNDTVRGGSGSDTIVISGAVGVNNNNIMTDFSIADGDRLDLKAYGITNSTQASELLSQSSNGVMLSVDEHVSVLFQDLDLAELIASEGWIA
jgi:hypothetical protein